MRVTEDLIVITAQDVSCRAGPAVESNCLADPSALLVESNCACPDTCYDMAQAPFQITRTPRYRLPTLYTGRVTQRFSLAANPLGQAGVIVFNRPVLGLLNAFHRPRCLDEGVLAAGDPPNGLSTARRLVSLGLLKPVDNLTKTRRFQAQTLTAWLHVTNACNLSCSYCFVRKSADAMSEERGRQAIDAVFRSALAHGYRQVKLKYAGGEPTLNFPLVLTLHDYARHLADLHDFRLHGVLLSNGVALTDGMIRDLRDCGLRLMISLDGVGVYHDAQRQFSGGRGSFERVEQSLDRLAAYDFKPSISITVSSRNLQGLPEVVRFVLERGFPFTLNFYRENNCSASYADLSYGDGQIVTAIRAAFAVIEANLPPYSLLGALVDLARLDAAHSRPCGVGESYLVIDQRGRVAKCHMEMEKAVTDVSFGDPLQVVREDRTGVQNPPVWEKEGCRDCTWRYWCAGGCPWLAHRMAGRFDVQSPNCRIYKAMFPEVLRLEGLRLLKYSGAISA